MRAFAVQSSAVCSLECALLGICFCSGWAVGSTLGAGLWHSASNRCHILGGKRFPEVLIVADGCRSIVERELVALNELHVRLRQNGVEQAIGAKNGVAWGDIHQFRESAIRGRNERR